MVVWGWVGDTDQIEDQLHDVTSIEELAVCASRGDQVGVIVYFYVESILYVHLFICIYILYYSNIYIYVCIYTICIYIYKIKCAYVYIYT